jgi:hypothetical protein
MFGQPTFGGASGARVGVTALNGSLAPIISPGFQTRLAANISAFAPFGLFGTTVSAGFSAGLAPAGSTSLATILSGTAVTVAGLAETIGGHAASHAEISITIEEWRIIKRPRGQFRRSFIRAVTFSPTVITNIWANGGFLGIGFQIDFRSNAPFTTAAGMPVVPGREYVIIANLVQTANYGVGLGSAISNVAFDFPPMFFAFS